MQSKPTFLTSLTRRLTAVVRRYWVALVSALIAIGLAVTTIPPRIGWQWAGFFWYTSIGDAGNYSFAWGCGRYDTVTSNGSGLIAKLHRVECVGGVLDPPIRDYFVFVHSAPESDRGTNLVLRYRMGADDTDWTIEPRVTWTSKRTLEIATSGLESDDYDLPTLDRTSIDDVSIRYVSGGVRVSPDYQYRRAPWTQFVTSGPFF